MDTRDRMLKAQLDYNSLVGRTDRDSVTLREKALHEMVRLHKLIPPPMAVTATAFAVVAHAMAVSLREGDTVH